MTGVDGMHFDAFISYRRENGFLMAQIIRERLKEMGITCFLDLEEDRSGNFNENLLAAIADAPNFILILPKNALNRCKNEDDWVRKEILAAAAGNKTIIPVMYDGFKWPAKWDPGIPEQIRQLQYQQGVSMSQEYLSAMIEKIASYMTDVQVRPRKEAQTASDRDSHSGSAFFEKWIHNNPDVQSVCMAFHAGSEWRRDAKKVSLLTEMIRRKVQLRILVNSGKAANFMCSHMKQPLKKYVEIDDCVSDWLELAELYPDSVEVRVSEIPIMHRIYLVCNGDDSGIINVKYYTYGNYMPEKDFRLSFSAETPEFRIYREEFEYLWEQAGTY